MDVNEQYFLAVDRRIAELYDELKNVQIERKNNSITVRKDKIKEYQIFALNETFLKRKIHYLEQLKQLPYYVFTYQLSRNQLISVRQMLGASELSLEEFNLTLLNKLHLQNFSCYIECSDQFDMFDFSEDFITDYSFILNLLAIKNQYENLEKQKQEIEYSIEIPSQLTQIVSSASLTKNGITKPLNYEKLVQLERHFEEYKEHLLNTILSIYTDYDFKKLNQVCFYKKHLSENNPLSRDFIEFYMPKVISKFPEFHDQIKSVTPLPEWRRVKWLPNGIRQFGITKKKRMKNLEDENLFLKFVLNFYNQDLSLANFGVENYNVVDFSQEQLKQLFAKVGYQKDQIFKAIQILNDNIRNAQINILKEAKKFEELQQKEKQKFKSLLHARFGSVISINDFQEKLWKEKNLKQKLIRLSCFLELEKLVDYLSEHHNDEELLNQYVLKLKKCFKNESKG